MYYIITKGDLYLQSPRVSGSQFFDVFADSSRQWRIYSKRLAQLIAGDIAGAEVIAVKKPWHYNINLSELYLW